MEACVCKNGVNSRKRELFGGENLGNINKTGIIL